LSDKLVEVIRSTGGKVLLHHKVTALELADGRIESIRFRNIMPGQHEEIAGRAKHYIANAALPEIAKMIDAKEGRKIQKLISSQTIGASLLTVYFGFSKALKELGHKYYSSFVFDESVKTQRDIHSNNRDDFTKRSFTFVDYSQVDSKLAPEGKSVGAICCIDYFDDWSGLDKEEYRKKKKVVEEAFSSRLEKLIPGCREYMEYAEVGTPKTVQRYTLNPKGAVYGFAQLPNREVPDVSGIVENLSIASAWGKFGGGFSGAIYSGYMCAVDLLRKQ
jgi:phytoene dehydrogenase-like protein